MIKGTVFEKEVGHHFPDGVDIYFCDNLPAGTEWKLVGPRAVVMGRKAAETWLAPAPQANQKPEAVTRNAVLHLLMNAYPAYQPASVILSQRLPTR